MQPIDYLLTRRSVKAANLAEPAPDDAQLELILRAATRVPDHGKLCPWRIRVLHKAGQAKLGELFAKRFLELNPDANEKQIEFERQRPQRAPLLLVVTSNPVESIKAPLWEQELSVGAVCMNILHAAHMLDFAGNWLTEWVAFDEVIEREMGGRIAGFIYIGTATEKPEERERPKLEDIVEEWK
ncbi:MAG: nitroreductase family protein [Rickettsiales bacterium]